VLTRATAAEALVAVWGNMGGVASNAGVQRAFTTALGVLFPGPPAFAPWIGVDPYWFGFVVRVALCDEPTDRPADIDAEANRLRADPRWRDALDRIDYAKRCGRLIEPLADALSPDLEAIEAELNLELAAELSLQLAPQSPPGRQDDPGTAAAPSGPRPARICCDESDRSVYLDGRRIAAGLERPLFGFVQQLAAAYPDRRTFKSIQASVGGLRGKHSTRDVVNRLPSQLQALIDSTSHGYTLRLPPGK
jgi:hypothetical protein